MSNIVIRETKVSEANELLKIQKEAFKPLYEKYHDEANPYLRDIDDVIKRTEHKNFIYYTIFFEDKIAGGMYYRIKGKRAGGSELKNGEIYLGRIYIKPELQGRGIAKTAILLSETLFPKAKTIYVDFPDDLERNRKCYTNAGFVDTGEKLVEVGSPTLAMYKKELR